MMRPNHTAGPPPGPGRHVATSTPLGTTSAGRGSVHSDAVCALTETKCPASADPPPAPSNRHAAAIGSCISGKGGMCRVVTSAVPAGRGMVRGIGCRELLWMTS